MCGVTAAYFCEGLREKLKARQILGPPFLTSEYVPEILKCAQAIFSCLFKVEINFLLVFADVSTDAG